MWAIQRSGNSNAVPVPTRKPTTTSRASSRRLERYRLTLESPSEGMTQEEELALLLWYIVVNQGGSLSALPLLSSPGKSGMCMLIRGNHRPLLCACLCLTLLPFFSTSTLLNAQDAEQEAQRHFAAARQAQDSGDLELAAQEYLKVTHLLPNVAEAYASLGHGVQRRRKIRGVGAGPQQSGKAQARIAGREPLPGY